MDVHQTTEHSGSESTWYSTIAFLTTSLFIFFLTCQFTLIFKETCKDPHIFNILTTYKKDNEIIPWCKTKPRGSN